VITLPGALAVSEVLRDSLSVDLQRFATRWFAGPKETVEGSVGEPFEFGQHIGALLALGAGKEAGRLASGGGQLCGQVGIRLANAFKYYNFILSYREPRLNKRTRVMLAAPCDRSHKRNNSCRAPVYINRQLDVFRSIEVPPS
jgi:hypothetical protein